MRTIRQIGRRILIPVASILLFPCQFLAASGGGASDSPYFPDRGSRALYQRRLELQTPARVMVLAFEPGEEDLSTMTVLRMEKGVQVVAVYLTNGGGTPSDDRDEIPTVVAGRRKEEAYRALSVIGSEAFFVNCPDVPLGAEGLREIWDEDSVGQKVVAAIDQYKPDLLMIPPGLRDSDTARARMLGMSLALVRQSRDDPESIRGGGPHWKVPRIFVEADSGEGGIAVNADRLHPFWKTSYLQIAGEAWWHYSSLRLTLHGRSERPIHWYRRIRPSGGEGIGSLIGNEPRLTPDLTWVREPISLAIEWARKNQKQNSLTALAEALARIEKLLVAKGGSLGGLEERVLAQWKDGLEDFRCSLDDVHAVVEPSDSIMSDRQVFFLRVQSLHLPVPAKATEILFPLARDSSWVINESGKYRFPLAVPSEFRILTPVKMLSNYPASLGGLTASEMRTNFPYYIVHKDANRSANFAYHGEVRLKVGPGRAIEVLTPVVRMTSGEEVDFALYNITRQPMRTDAWVKDSVIADSRAEVFLARKDQVTVNRIPLHWTDLAGLSDHIAEIHIGRAPVAQFLVRSFDVRVDSTVVTGLVSAIPEGILGTSIRRLHIPWVALDSSAMRKHAWDTCAVIVIDRNAVALRTDLRDASEELERWVSNGGKLILFPQHGEEGKVGKPFAFFHFTPDVVPPDAVIGVKGARLTQIPNSLHPADWQGWLVSYSTDRISAGGGLSADTVAVAGGTPTLLRYAQGRGSVTAVSLDFVHQLLTLHPGACRVLANILSY